MAHGSEHNCGEWPVSRLLFSTTGLNTSEYQFLCFINPRCGIEPDVPFKGVPIHVIEELTQAVNGIDVSVLICVSVP